MNTLRHHIHRRRWWATALIVAALLIAILVPAGYMPTMTNGVFQMRPCAGQDASFAMIASAAGAPDRGTHGKHHGDLQDGDHGGLGMSCIFTSLAAPALGAIDPILLAITIAFILAAAFRLETRPVHWRRLYLRPPAQGPPLV